MDRMKGFSNDGNLGWTEEGMRETYPPEAGADVDQARMSLEARVPPQRPAVNDPALTPVVGPLGPQGAPTSVIRPNSIHYNPPPTVQDTGRPPAPRPPPAPPSNYNPPPGVPPPMSATGTVTRPIAPPVMPQPITEESREPVSYPDKRPTLPPPPGQYTNLQKRMRENSGGRPPPRSPTAMERRSAVERRLAGRAAVEMSPGKANALMRKKFYVPPGQAVKRPDKNLLTQKVPVEGPSNPIQTVVNNVMNELRKLFGGA